MMYFFAETDADWVVTSVEFVSQWRGTTAHIKDVYEAGDNGEFICTSSDPCAARGHVGAPLDIGVVAVDELSAFQMATAWLDNAKAELSVTVTEDGGGQ